jgi:hypothetical protein
MNCPGCGKEVKYSHSWKTLVGYISVEGHNHDDNCLIREYYCKDCRLLWNESLRRKCSVPGCKWVGKEECFCHKGKKVDRWTD